MDVTACFVSASRQNVFFTELLDAFAEALAGKGIAVERAVDCFPEIRAGLVYVYVPHELLPLLMPDAHPSEPQLRRSVTVCTEQPGTHWFNEDVRIAKRAAAAIDINRLGMSAMKKLGVDARFLQLGYVPAWDHWHQQRLERPIDVTFQGAATARRLTALSQCGHLLAGRRSELHLFDSVLPHQQDSEHFLSGARKWEMLRSSKVLLNIHRSELGYLEWQRAIGALVNGCVFLTEHSLGFEPLVPGEHFVSASFENVDVALEALLGDEDRLSGIRTAAYEFLRHECPLSRSIEVLAEAIGEVASRAMPSPRSRARRVLPRPRPLDVQPTEYDRIVAEQTDLDVLRMAVKQVLLEQRALRRTLDAVQRALSEEQHRDDVTECFGARRSDPPRVSVVMTVYNYAPVVAAAIDSVAASEFADYELVIVDDASTDDSGERIRDVLARVPWAATKLVTRSKNGGLARARNLGVEIAEGEFVFILDADNAIYPHCLGRLVHALDQAPAAAFAYGIVEQFGIRGPTSLISFAGWDARRLRHGNFVDAMALIRRAALLDAGGYTTEPRLYGWEDFALWCEFADRGWWGVRVPEIVARYRVGLHSMISVTNIDASAAWGLLVDRFACLSS